MKPGDRVAFTTYGRKGEQIGTLNGLTNEGTGYGIMAHIRTPLGVVTRPLDRVREI